MGEVLDSVAPTPAGVPFRVLAVTQGLWGERIAQNVAAHAPRDWEVTAWGAPRLIPPIVDDPEEFLPDALPQTDLLLALGEVSGLAQLIPDIVRLTGARAVLAPIDRSESLPSGLALQLEGWLAEAGVPIVFPMPFCSLTPETINRPPRKASYDDPLIRRFATHFGRPIFAVAVEKGRITEVQVVRDAACGCARHVADGLVDVSLEDAAEQAGLLHHHYPCLASMNKDPDYQDTLMHVSGNFLKEALNEALTPHRAQKSYLRPSGFSEIDPPTSPQA
jgi:thymidylate synthase